MNKTEIIAEVAEKAGVTKAVATATLNATLDAITESLSKEETVALAGFGTFAISEQAARKGRNPRTGEEIDLPAVKLAKFRPSQKLKDSVK